MKEDPADFDEEKRKKIIFGKRIPRLAKPDMIRSSMMVKQPEPTVPYHDTSLSQSQSLTPPIPASLNEHPYIHKMMIPGNLVAHVIGRNGWKINAIQDNTAAKMSFKQINKK